MTAEAIVKMFKGPKDSLLDLKFTADGKSLVGLSKSEVYFIDHALGTPGIKKGTGWSAKTCEKQVTLAVGVTSAETLVGAQSGKILRFKGNAITGVLDAHTGSVNAIFTRKKDKGIISGGNDGLVIVWDEALTKSKVISAKDVKDFPVFNPRIRAVCEHKDGSICFGTRSSNIVQVDASGKMKTVNNGSFDGELWGLAAIPGSDDYVTVGEDFMVCRYTTQNPRALKATKIPYMATAVEVSGDGKVVAVGCKNGHTLILNCADFSKIKEIPDRKKQVSELKFSPNGKYLAIAAHDSRIRIYNTAGWKQIGECRGHHSTVTHVDWSEDSESLQSNCTSYELLFWTAASCKQNTSAKAYRNENWATWTCVIGWPVQGIFPKFSDGSDVNAVCRNKARTVLASADDFGTVKLFKYPVTEKQANANVYNGHSSHVTNVRFTSKEDFVISTGGNDKATIMWKFKPQGGDAEAEESNEVDTEGYNPDEFRVQEPEEREEAPGQPAAKQKVESDMFDVADEEQGDQFMAVKPFLGEVKNSWPSGFKAAPGSNNAPDGNLALRHAFGFRCHDAKDTAKFLASSGSVCFITAALGVTMDIRSNVQAFFNKHDEDLVSMDVTADRKFCATGSMPAKGRSKLLDIYVWDTETKKQAAFLTGFHRGAVKVLKFSPSGRLLLSVGRDDNNSLAVYDWLNNIKVCDSKVDRCEVFDAAWNDENTFATITKDAIKFWSLKKGSCSAVKGAWGKDKKVVLASCAYVAGVCFSGGWNGQIIPWQAAAKGKPVEAHKGAIFCLHYDQQRGLLLSGGKDGLVKAWAVSGSSLTPKGVLFDYLAGNPEMKVALGIRSIDSHADGSLLVGTREAEIFHVAKDKTISNVMKGHYDGELWSVAAHPLGTLCVSAGGDKSIRTFCVKERSIAALYFHESDIRAVDWSADGKLIVAASVVGEIILLSPTLDHLDQRQSSFQGKNQWIEDIRFSPDCSMVAYGAHGGRSPIEILKVEANKLNKYCSINVGLTSALLHLDWSADSAFIVCNSQAYELKFASISAQKSVSASSSKDIDWASWTCKLGFPVQGIFPGVDGTDVNTVCRAANRKVMATGDDFQKVNLFKYPSTQPKSGCKRYTGHSSHVTRVRFMLNDNVLVSTGGNDKTLLVWTTDFGGEIQNKDDNIFLEGESRANQGEEEEIE